MRKLLYILPFLIFSCKTTQVVQSKSTQDPARSLAQYPIEQALQDAADLKQKAIEFDTNLKALIQEPDGVRDDAEAIDDIKDDIWQALLSTEETIKYLKGSLPEVDLPDGYLGYGSGATGGQGQQIVYMTNLNDSGPGSLREAVSQGDRIVHSTVSGIVWLDSKIDIEKPNISLLFSSSPQGWVEVRNYPIQIEASNIIIQGLRHTKTVGAEMDAVVIKSYSGRTIENIVIDHCTILSATDGNFDINATSSNATARNITISNSILGNAKKNSLLIGNVYNVTMAQNLMVGNNERHPRAGGNPKNHLTVELVNNAMVDFRYGSQVDMGLKFNAINNHYKTNRAATSKAIEGVATGFDSETHAYLTGNIFEGIGSYNSRIAPYVKGSPFSSSGIVPKPMSEMQNIINQVGCGHPEDEVLIAKY